MPFVVGLPLSLALFVPALFSIALAWLIGSSSPTDSFVTLLTDDYPIFLLIVGVTFLWLSEIMNEMRKTGRLHSRKPFLSLDIVSGGGLYGGGRQRPPLTPKQKIAFQYPAVLTICWLAWVILLAKVIHPIL